MHPIETMIRQMNQAWVEGRFEELGDYFHEEVVMLMPGSPHILRGREPMVASYREFTAMARVHQFAFGEIALFPFGSLTMAHARFSVDYEIPSGRFAEEGMEIYAITTEGPSPKILWRTQVALEPSEN